MIDLSIDSYTGLVDVVKIVVPDGNATGRADFAFRTTCLLISTRY